MRYPDQTIKVQRSERDARTDAGAVDQQVVSPVSTGCRGALLLLALL
jgi:hypothetical protein